MPFYDFYLIFFFTKIAKKGIYYLQVMTWRAGPSSELTWHAGPERGCDVALTPRGRATAGPREAHVALTRGRRPRGRVHEDTHVGRHVACWGFAYGGPTGIVGPW